MENKKVILIMEDEETLRDALSDKIKSEGFSVLEAKNGEEGLELALKEHPDLILVDIVMPKMDGFTMLEKLQEDEFGKNIKFIIITNVSELDEMSKVLNVKEKINHKSFDYLIKSDIKLEQIMQKIKEKLV